MRELHRHWKGILFRGIFALLFGLAALFYPGLSFQVLVLFFGTFSVIDGIIALFVGSSIKSGLLVFEGIVGMLVGLYVFLFTSQATVIFIMLLGIWALATGILEILSAIELRRHIANEIWLLFVGIVSVLFGIFVFINPVASALALTYVIGIYAIVFGLFLIALGVRVRTIRVPSRSPRRKRSRK